LSFKKKKNVRGQLKERGGKCRFIIEGSFVLAKNRNPNGQLREKLPVPKVKHKGRIENMEKTVNPRGGCLTGGGQFIMKGGGIVVEPRALLPAEGSRGYWLRGCSGEKKKKKKKNTLQ